METVVKRKKVILSRVEMDYNGHVDAGEHYFGRRFFWSEIACGLAKWLYIGKHSYFFPEFESLSPSKLNKSFVSFFATIQNMDEEVSIPPPPSWKLRITETRPKCPVCLLCNLTMIEEHTYNE